MGSFATLFSKQAAQYSKFRMSYPSDLWSIIAQYCGDAHPRGTAVDVACGTGQATRGLAAMFDCVVALDANEQQLAHASAGAHENVTFRQGTAEQTGLEDSVADLVACAQALHWFDLRLFYRECVRILKPDGVLAVWGYDVPKFPNPEAQQAFMQFYMGEQGLGPYWTPRRSLVAAHYAERVLVTDMEPKMPTEFLQVSRQTVEAKQETTLEALAGYLTSWSAYQLLAEEAPGRAEELLQQLLSDLSQQLGCSQGGASNIVYSVPIFIILAKNPNKQLLQHIG